MYELPLGLLQRLVGVADDIVLLLKLLFQVFARLPRLAVLLFEDAAVICRWTGVSARAIVTGDDCCCSPVLT